MSGRLTLDMPLNAGIATCSRLPAFPLLLVLTTKPALTRTEFSRRSCQQRREAALAAAYPHRNAKKKRQRRLNLTQLI